MVSSKDTSQCTNLCKRCAASSRCVFRSALKLNYSKIFRPPDLVMNRLVNVLILNSLKMYNGASSFIVFYQAHPLEIFTSSRKKSILLEIIFDSTHVPTFILIKM
jgi:hypothetical protein